MLKTRLPTILALSGIVLVGAGCANNQPTTADMMRDHAAAQGKEVALKQDLAEDWEKGNKLIDSGEKRVERAEKEIRQAEKDLREARKALQKGEREIEQGTKLRSRSERKFRNAFPESALAS
ncbi:hypothetical protein [Halopseudomonas sp.]|jgi:septal ring factor EnvC (AmiA/AmiB activator)|uniref:hypothetical protein n=1 Tax=Halopseudomonas sp. TaxID=2901191 RepID=UPI00300282FF|tara:strand:- start:1820 stop:2185 length:366 start_codon:yes stop_codon:yes gene_type:complete